MGSLGYNVPLHRTLAFGFGAFIASLAGVLYVWWQGQIAPGDVELAATIKLLVMAVIGGLTRIEGAWLGAFAFILIAELASRPRSPERRPARSRRELQHRHRDRLSRHRLVSPDGLIGIWDRILARRRARDR